MTKQDFLETLRRALNGNMAAVTVDDHIRFYDSYFISETAKGRSEADILSSLGDPRILARTLIDAAERAGDSIAQEANETQYRNAGSYQDTDASYNDTGYGIEKKVRLPGWLIAILVIVVVVAAVQIIGSIVFALLPYILPVVIVVYLIKLIKK